MRARLGTRVAKHRTTSQDILVRVQEPRFWVRLHVLVGQVQSMQRSGGGVEFHERSIRTYIDRSMLFAYQMINDVDVNKYVVAHPID